MAVSVFSKVVKKVFVQNKAAAGEDMTVSIAKVAVQPGITEEEKAICYAVRTHESYTVAEFIGQNYDELIKAWNKGAGADTFEEAVEAIKVKFDADFAERLNKMAQG